MNIRGGDSVPFKARDKIVFIGDSITDKGRKKDPLKLGSGYVRAAARLSHSLIP